MKRSAGILLYRIHNQGAEVLLLHPGGPFYKNKEQGVWSIPKGELAENENIKEAALREFEEETGKHIADGHLIPLEPIRQKGGKIVYAFALEGDFNVEEFKSNFFQLEWPPHSGKMLQFPEMDKAQWFTIKEAREKIISSQILFLQQLENRIK